MQFETENVEFKSQMLENLYKEIVAFANTDGGTIYIGVDNAGNIIGIDDMDDTYTKITNGIRDAILPDVTMFIKYAMHEGRVIKIEVGEGAYKPYYLKAKGLKPSGVYIRQGASSAPASSEQIRHMIKESDSDIFENMRSMEQQLSFHSASAAFARYGIDFSEEKYPALGIRSLHDNLFTNLAWILSDNCCHTIKIAVFNDDDNTSFQDRKEFTGSIFRQLEDAYSYLTLCNKISAEINGLERIEHPDYPQSAVREALLNALVHRDYSFSGSIIINVNHSSMEFVSIGGLPSGLSAQDICSGISQPRNRRLAEIFHRLKLIESYGTGIRRIYHLYRSCALQPRIEVTPNTFRLVLPNLNETATVMHTAIPAEKASLTITPQIKSVLDYLAEYGELTDEELQELLGVKRTRAYVLSKQMKEAGLIRITGRGSTKRYLSS